MQPTTEPTTAAEAAAAEPRRWAFEAVFGVSDYGAPITITFEIHGLRAAEQWTALQKATSHMAVVAVDGFAPILRRDTRLPRPARICPSRILLLQIDDRATELIRFEEATAEVKAAAQAYASHVEEFRAVVEEFRAATAPTERLADPAEAELAALSTATAALGDRFAHSAGA